MTAPALDRFVHRFVPAPEGAPRRTLVLLHGTGGNEDDLLPIGRRLDPAAALLSPRGLVLEHGMPRFFRRVAEGVFDLEDLERRTHELADFLAAAAAHYALDPGTLVAVGYSNGANIGANLLQRRPEVIGDAVLFRAMLPFEPEPPKELGGRRVLLSSGRLDPVVPVDQPERLAEVLRRAGADVTLAWSRAGHGLEEEEIERAAAWLDWQRSHTHRADGA